MIKKVLYRLNGNNLDNVEYWTGFQWITLRQCFDTALGRHMDGSVNRAVVAERSGRWYNIDLTIEIQEIQRIIFAITVRLAQASSAIIVVGRNPGAHLRNNENDQT